MSRLDLLPERSGGAAENMAADFLLLKRYPYSGYARFRHYGWHRPSFTFGYSQRIAYVREQLPAGERFDLCRRPTGGGVVDHREDWTYALVLPRGHTLADAPAPVSYREIHAAITRALVTLGVPAELKRSCDADEGEACEKGPTVCFERPERYDVVRTDDGRKIAGAAQKRTKDGLLCQGSIARPVAGAGLNWDQFQSLLVTELQAVLALPAEAVGWPDFPEGEWEQLTEQYSAEEWTSFR